MGFQPQFQGYARFRETLKHEDHIHNQIEVCRNTLNRGDRAEVMNAVESLLTLVTPHMEDEEFLAELEENDEKWKKELAKRTAAYERRRKMAADGCPDLVPKPDQKPDLDHWKKVFMIACALFERKGLMLKIDVEDSV